MGTLVERNQFLKLCGYLGHFLELLGFCSCYMRNSRKWEKSPRSDNEGKKKENSLGTFLCCSLSACNRLGGEMRMGRTVLVAFSWEDKEL